MLCFSVGHHVGALFGRASQDKLTPEAATHKPVSKNDKAPSPPRPSPPAQQHQHQPPPPPAASAQTIAASNSQHHRQQHQHQPHHHYLYPDRLPPNICTSSGPDHRARTNALAYESPSTHPPWSCSVLVGWVGWLDALLRLQIVVLGSFSFCHLHTSQDYEC